MKKQMSDGNSTCPLVPMDKQNSNGHSQVHWIHCIQWTLSFGYRNGTVSTWGPWACHYVIQIHGNWPTEKANVGWKFHCPLDPMDKQNFNWHSQIHWIHWIQWTLSFGYLNGTVSTWGPWSCHYVIQIHGNSPTEKANVRWKFHLPIGSNGQKKFQWTFPGPLDPIDTFVWLSQWKSIYMRSRGLSLRHSNTW
jgi:hypothetical protein